MKHTLKRILSAALACVMALALLPASALAVDNPAPEGTVTATKDLMRDEQGNPVVDGNGYYTLKLSVAGIPYTEEVATGADVVLVVDTSGSMSTAVETRVCGSTSFTRLWYGYECNECHEIYDWWSKPSSCTNKVPVKTRMDVAIDAAQKFVDQLLPSDTLNKLAVIGFAGNNQSGGANDNTAIKVATSLTNDAATLKSKISTMQANDATNYSAALQKAYAILNARSEKDSRPAYVIFISDGAPGWSGQSANNPNWNGTVQAADLEGAGVTIYAIGIEMSGNASALTAISSQDKAGNELYQNVTDGDMETQLPNILKDLANQINKTPAGQNAVLTDVVDTSKFDIRTYSDDLALAEDGKTLTWTIGDIPEEEQTVTIKVKAKDGIYGTDIPTNTNVYLNYTNPKDNSSVTIPESQIGRPTVTILDTRPRYTVTYTDGVPDEVVFADQTTSNLLAGDKTPAFSGTPTRTGYNFAGWSPKVDEEVAAPASGNTITYVAQWTKRADLSYTVNYLEKGTNKVLAKAKTVNNQTFGSSVTENAIDITGYNKVDPTSATITIATTGNVITFYYTARTDLTYTVNYLEKDTNKVLATAKTVNNQTFGTVVQATNEKIFIDGYNYDSADKATLTIGTGENVINLYYTRNSYNVTYQYNGTVPAAALALPDSSTYKYGDTVFVAPAAVAQGYTFSGWATADATITSGRFTMPSKNVTITGSFSANTDTRYTIEYYLEDLSGGTFTKDASATQTKTGTTDTTAEIASGDIKTFNGFTYDANNDNNVLSGTIKGDGSLVLKLYYTRNSYTVTYDYGTAPTGASALPAGGTYKFGETVPVAEVATAPGYMFIGWDSGDVIIDPASNNFTMPAKNVTITGTWELDTWSDKDNSIEEGDGIPDKYQVAVKYVSEDTVKGTVNPQLEVLTIYGDDRTTPATSGTVIADGSTATATSDYFFNKWTKAVNEDSATETELTAATGSILLENVKGGDVITFTAYFTQKDTSVEVTKNVSSIKTPDEKEYESLTTAKVGDTITWTIKVENTGNVEQTFTLEDILSNTESLTATDSTGAEVTAITLAAGNYAIYTVTYQVQLSDSGTTLTNIAVVKDNGEEKDKDTSEGVQIEPAVTIEKSVNKTTASVGDKLTYTITVTNNASVNLNNIVITDAMLGMTGDNVVVIPVLEVGGIWSDTYTYTVKSTDAGKNLVNTAIASTEDGKELDRDSTDGTSIRVPSKPTKPSQPALNTEDHVAYIIGYDDGTVKPTNNITRAEVATIFFRLLTDDSRAEFWSQTNSYSDVSSNNWFNNAVSTLSNAGIISGYPDGTFKPNAPITRAEFAAIATRFSDASYTGRCTFTDVPADHWAANAIALAQDLGWINGYSDGTFKPNQPITRAEAMTLINRVLERAVDRDHMLADMVTWTDNRPGSWYYEAVQEATNSHEYTRTGVYVPSQSFCYENWVKILEAPDWAALENAWSTANSQ